MSQGQGWHCECSGKRWPQPCVSLTLGWDLMGVTALDPKRETEAGVSLWLGNEAGEAWGGSVLKENGAGAGGSEASNQSLPFYMQKNGGPKTGQDGPRL